MPWLSTLRSRWRRWHMEMLEQEKQLLNFPGPADMLRFYNSFVSYFRIRAAWDLAAAQKGDRVLLVGDGGGKDYWYFAWHGFQCQVLDVAEQEVIPGLILGDISAAECPFPPGSFDQIVMCDVLEHLYDDRRALLHLRAMLKPAGRLVLSGPYWHDAAEHHVRIHSPRIIERMLRHHGFKLERLIFRGFLVSVYRLIHPALLLLHYLLYRWTGRIYAPALNQRLYHGILKIQAWSAIPYLDRLLFGQRGGLNGYVLWASKTDLPLYDVVARNRADFINYMKNPGI